MRKRWKPVVVTVLVILLITGYFVFYYSSWSVQQVPAGVDGLISIDKKRLIRTIGWEYLTHPKRWKWSSGSEDASDTSLTDLVQIPDYCILFRLKEAPADGFCLRLEIKDKPLLLLYLRNQQFKATTIGGGRLLLQNPAYPIQALIAGNEILVSQSGSACEQALIRSADLLFNQHQYIRASQIDSLISHPAHLNFWSDGSRESGRAWSLQANYETDSLVLHGNLPWLTVSANPSSAPIASRNLPLRFNLQNGQWFTEHIPELTRSTISRAAGFSIDTVFGLAGIGHQFELTGMHTRTDSSIRISTDDNFNEVRDTLLTPVREPEINWSIYGPKTEEIFHYFLQQDLIDSSTGIALFRPIPLAPVRILSFSRGHIWCGSNWLPIPKETAFSSPGNSPSFELEADLAYWLNEFNPMLKPEQQKWLRNLGRLNLRIIPAHGNEAVSMILKKKQEHLPLFDWY